MAEYEIVFEMVKFFTFLDAFTQLCRLIVRLTLRKE